MPVYWGTDEILSADAVCLALALGRPIYDCVNRALAHRIGPVTLTADLGFANALAPTEHGELILPLVEHAGK